MELGRDSWRIHSKTKRIGSGVWIHRKRRRDGFNAYPKLPKYSPQALTAINWKAGLWEGCENFKNLRSGEQAAQDDEWARDGPIQCYRPSKSEREAK